MPGRELGKKRPWRQADPGLHGLESAFQPLYAPLARPPSAWSSTHSGAERTWDLTSHLQPWLSCSQSHPTGNLKTAEFSDLQCSPVQNKLKTASLSPVVEDGEFVFRMYFGPYGMTKNTARKFSSAIFPQSSLVSKLKSRNCNK